MNSKPMTQIKDESECSVVNLTTSNSSSSREITSVKSMLDKDGGFRDRESSVNTSSGSGSNSKNSSDNPKESDIQNVCKMPLRKTATQKF
jgi:hypothetical protein